MKDSLNIALLQADLSWENPIENRRVFTEKIMALSTTIDIAVLPEMFTTGFTMHPEKYAESINGETILWMQKLANEKQLAITGSMIIKEGEKFYNRMAFVHPNGKIDSYDKRHLFTYGGEDKVYSAGNRRLIVDYKNWKICPMICYDLRFPVWSRNNDEYDILIYVANWPKSRISAWDTLLKARAIENMAYTIGLNRVGIDGNKLEYIGHSQAFDILGNELITSANDRESIFEITLNKTKLIDTRNKFGFLKDKDSFSIEK